MNVRLFALVLGLALAALVGDRTAGASDARLPAALYPPGTQLSFEPHVSNAEMDFNWGFACDCRRPRISLPQPRTLSLFHLRHQDSLHRTSGWSQLGITNQNHQSTQFILFASRYATVNNRERLPWGRQAMIDLRLSAWLHGYRPIARPPNLLLGIGTGGVLAVQRRYGSVSVLLLAYHRGTREAECMVSTTGGRALQQLARQDLIRQINTVETEMP